MARLTCSTSLSRPVSFAYSSVNPATNLSSYGPRRDRHRRLRDADAIRLHHGAAGWSERDRWETGHVASGIEILWIDVLQHRKRCAGLDHHAARELQGGQAGHTPRSSDAARDDH